MQDESELRVPLGETPHLRDVPRFEVVVPARGPAPRPDAPPGAAKASRLDLLKGVTVEPALIRTLRHCLGHLRANEACVIESEDIEGVHQMRVALRRLRSALRMFRSVVPDAQYRALAGEMKWAAECLAAARNWDVLADEIVEPVARRHSGEAAFGALRVRLGAERRRCRAAARAAVRAPRYARFLVRIDAWLARREWRGDAVDGALLDGPMVALSSALLTKRQRAVVDRARRFATLPAAERHRLRVDVKRLRYAIDFFASLYPPVPVKTYAAGLGDIQDALGFRNDIAMARDLLARIGEGGADDEIREIRRASAVVLDWHARAAARTEEALAHDIGALVARAPFWAGG